MLPGEHQLVRVEIYHGHQQLMQLFGLRALRDTHHEI